MNRTRFTALLIVVTAISSAHCQEREREREAKIKAARAKIEELVREAKKLSAKGAKDKARALIKKAEDIEAELRQRKRRTGEKDEYRKSKGKRPLKYVDNIEKVVQGLRAGAASLRALGRVDEAEKMQQLAAELIKKAKKGRARRKTRNDNEREVAIKQLRVMKMALEGLKDDERSRKAGEHLMLAIRALEMRLEGVKGEKAERFYKKAPSFGNRIELLMFASRNLRKAGKADKAKVVGDLANRWLKIYRARNKRSKRGDNREREVAEAQIKTMRTALIALREGEKKEWATVLNRAMQARVVRLRRLKGEEAEIVLKREPKLEQTVKALYLAAELWQDFRNKKNSQAVSRLAKQLGSKLKGRDKPTERRRKVNDRTRRIRALQARIEELKAALDKSVKELKELDRKRRD